MKTLYLLRHAKASRDAPGADFDRPLAPRGRAAARAMAEHLVTERVRPQLVLCSAALRTRETLERLNEALGDAERSIEGALYEATQSTILKRLRMVPETVHSVMLIGHNPGLERLARALCAGRGDAEALARLDPKYPTGALATLAVAVERWSELVPGCCRLQAFVRPADLE